MEKNKPRIPLKQYVEFYFMKFSNLSTMHLALLIHPLVKTDMPISKLQAYISNILNILKRQGKVEKVGNKKWKWVKQ
jgi:hypothetical protein